MKTVGIMALLLLLLAGGVAASPLMDTQKYESVKGDSRSTIIHPVSAVAVDSEGYLLPSGVFLAFVPLEQYRFVYGESRWVENIGGTWTKFGYGFFNEIPSYEAHKAGTSTDPQIITNEKVLEVESAPTCSVN